MNGTLTIAEFISGGKPPAEARQPAAIALRDTVGVILAGAPEAAAGILRRTRRLHCRLRNRVPSWTRHESPALPRARLALHLLDWNSGSSGGRGSPAWTRRAVHPARAWHSGLTRMRS